MVLAVAGEDGAWAGRSLAPRRVYVNEAVGPAAGGGLCSHRFCMRREFHRQRSTPASQEFHQLQHPSPPPREPHTDPQTRIPHYPPPLTPIPPPQTPYPPPTHRPRCNSTTPATPRSADTNTSTTPFKTNRNALQKLHLPVQHGWTSRPQEHVFPWGGQRAKVDETVARVCTHTHPGLSQRITEAERATANSAAAQGPRCLHSQ